MAAPEKNSVKNWMPWHVGDYMRATMALTLEEDAIYRRLLDALWCAGGRLQYDRERLLRLLRIDAALWPACESVIREFCDVSADGVLTQSRLLEELGKAGEKSSKAKASAGARWGNDANAMRSHMRSHAKRICDQDRPDDETDGGNGGAGDTGNNCPPSTDPTGNSQQPEIRQNGQDGCERTYERNANAYANAMRTHMQTQCDRNAHNLNLNHHSLTEASLPPESESRTRVGHFAIPQKEQAEAYCTIHMPQLDFERWWAHWDAIGWIDRDGRPVIWKHRAVWAVSDTDRKWLRPDFGGPQAPKDPNRKRQLMAEAVGAEGGAQ